MYSWHALYYPIDNACCFYLLFVSLSVILIGILNFRSLRHSSESFSLLVIASRVLFNLRN